MNSKKRKAFQRKGKFLVYIVECIDGTYYTGYTNDLERRIKEHNNSKRGAKYTRYKRPVRLIWSKKYHQFRSAFKVERIIKDLTRKQKEALVNGRRLDKVLEEARKYGNRK